VFVNKLVSKEFPAAFVQGCEQGVREACDNGALAGFPVIGVQVELLDAACKEDVSSELSFKIAGAMCFRELCAKADPVLMEPVMETEVVTPDVSLGDVIADLSARRAKVHKTDASGTNQIVKAIVPLSRMFGYATDLRSVSQGRATYTMLLHGYDRVPKTAQEEIIGRIKGTNL
jgi:elongation factor G